MTDLEVEYVFDNYPRSEWVEHLKDYLIESYEPYTTETDDFPVPMHFTCYEIDHVFEFPFEIGDIVTSKTKGGRFIICDYPWLDRRKIIPEGETLGFNMVWEGNLYKFYGFTADGKEAARDDLDVDHYVEWLQHEGWHHTDFEKIGTIDDLEENDPLIRILDIAKEVYPRIKEKYGIAKKKSGR